MVKNPPAMQETQERKLDPWLQKISWRRKWQLIQVFLPEKSHGEKPARLQSMGLQTVGHDRSN